MANPAETRGSPFEGWYWRIVDPAGRRVVVALCGVCRPRRGGPWAVVALAAHPGGLVRWDVVEGAAGAQAGFGTVAHPLLEGTDGRLRAAVGDSSIDVSLSRPLLTRRPSLGPVGVLPRLPQYWHAHVLDAEVTGSAVVAGERWELDGARAYTEKNWGPEFAADWWWGQAFLEKDVEVSFAGGRVGPLAPTGAVLRLGDDVHRLVAPLALVTAEVGEAGWRVRARSPRLAVEIEGDAAGHVPHVLPVPEVEQRRCVPRSHQHLAGRLRLVVRSGRRLHFSGESDLAGLERGLPHAVPRA